MRKLLLKITDLSCPACVMRLEGLEDELPGVQSASASYQKQTMEVVYDEALLNPEQILTAIQSIGYTPVLNP